MAVTFQHFTAAIQRSLAGQLADELEEQAKLDAKRASQAEQEAAWQEELKRREAEEPARLEAKLQKQAEAEAQRAAELESREQEIIDAFRLRHGIED
jgi:hypothetical protein